MRIVFHLSVDLEVSGSQISAKEQTVSPGVSMQASLLSNCQVGCEPVVELNGEDSILDDDLAQVNKERLAAALDGHNLKVSNVE